MQEMLPAAVALARALLQMTILQLCPLPPSVRRGLESMPRPASQIRLHPCSAPLPTPLSSPGFHMLDSCLMVGSGAADWRCKPLRDLCFDEVCCNWSLSLVATSQLLIETSCWTWTNIRNKSPRLGLRNCNKKLKVRIKPLWLKLCFTFTRVRAIAVHSCDFIRPWGGNDLGPARNGRFSKQAQDEGSNVSGDLKRMGVVSGGGLGVEWSQMEGSDC